MSLGWYVSRKGVSGRQPPQRNVVHFRELIECSFEEVVGSIPKVYLRTRKTSFSDHSSWII